MWFCFNGNGLFLIGNKVSFFFPLTSSRILKTALNIVGQQVRKLRNERGWTQEFFAQKLQLAGWDVSRTSLAKLESGLRWVSDCELLFLAKVLSVGLEDLFPAGLELKKLGPQFRKS
jgi:DNA-binding XRE family transcriptional regulator